MVDIDGARRFLAAEFENAGLPHVAGDILAGTSPFGQGAYIAAVAAALTASAHGTAYALEGHAFGWWLEDAAGVGYFSRRMQPAALYAYRTTPGYSATAVYARKGLEAV